MQNGIPRGPSESELRSAGRAGTEACPYEWPLEKRKASTSFVGPEFVRLPGAGGRGGPPLRGGFVNKSQFCSCLMAIQ